MDQTTIITQDLSPISLCMDAWQRLRVSNPASLFECKQTFDEQPLFFSLLGHGVGGGTIVYTNATQSSTLSVTTANDNVIRQTRRYINYQTGKSLHILMGFHFIGGSQAGTVKRVGYFDNANGYFLEASGGSYSVVMRSGGVDLITVPRTQWSDPLDGRGPSGLNVDLSTRQTLCVSIAGTSGANVHVGLFNNGRWTLLHRFSSSNSSVNGPLRTNLPIRWQCSSSGGAGAIESVSCAASAEGGQELIGSRRLAYLSTPVSIVSGGLQAVLSIRNRGGQYLRAPLIPRDISLVSTTAANAQWLLVVNPTLAGTAVWTDIANSYAQFDTARTAWTEGTGTVIGSGFFSTSLSVGSFELREALQLGADVAGTTRDDLALVVRNMSASPNSFAGSIAWLEPS